ncbi:uncharacterized protein LOC113499578 [Trichoplusia ni]|uniref:Uncharacterized protein LOC113499578 n=1 Tax=Trichoplusia ni TaxID=7111 RepID=A0A7E5W5I3_TRINI|nr:uncharacterized protein LOC113499578 [Trichoplusia ni]
MTKVIFSVTCLLLVLVRSNHAARVLAVFPSPSISHQVVFRPLTQELVKRGHEVTVITPDPVFKNTGAPPNLTEIDVHDVSYKIWQDTFLKKSSKGEKSDLVPQITIIFEAFYQILEAQLKSKEVQALINDKNKQFDLLLLEACVRSTIVFSHIYKNIPVILVSSLGGTNFNYEVLGAAGHPILFPDFFHQKVHNLTFWEKLHMLYTHYQLTKLHESIAELEDSMLQKQFGPNIQSVTELSNNVDMLFLNIHPMFEGVRPVPPSVVYIEGLHLKPQKELSTDLKSYLDSSKNGVIYLSFGTNVVPSDLPKEKIAIFTKVFSQLPYDVLWKWDKDDLPGRSDNIRIAKWLPQSDLLRHPKVKAFITQGGLQSTDEAIVAGVPMIGFPMLGDQWFNVEKYKYHKIGIGLDIETVTEQTLENAIKTVIEDESFRRNIRRVRNLMQDNLQPPLERAIWWVEHVLRHGGAKHLRSPAANISWAEYLELELVLTLLAGLFTIFTITIFTIYKLYFHISTFLKSKSKVKVFCNFLNVSVSASTMSTILYILLYFIFVTTNEASRILAVVPTPSISHQAVFRTLTQELVKRGHEVTVITTDPEFKNIGAPPNLTEIDVHDVSYKIWHDTFITKASKGKKNDIVSQMEIVFKGLTQILEAQLQTKEVQALISDKGKSFDLLLLEACVRPALIFSHIYKNVPVILISSMGGTNINYKVIGAEVHPLLYPDHFHQSIYNLTSWEKLRALYTHYQFKKLHENMAEFEDTMLQKQFGDDLPSVTELSSNVDMLFLNIHPIFEGIRPVPPSVVYIEGLHLKPQKELPTDLKSYLDSSKNGVIYLSFGTNVVPSDLPKEKIAIFTKVFSQLPYDVLWKWDNDDLPGRSDNIRIAKWLPQSDLLRHPKVKAFITQGGLQSTDEAVVAGVPMIGFPMLGDQWFNVEKYKYHNIGIGLDIETVTEQILENAIKTVIEDESFRRNIQRLRTIMQENPQPPLERAIWWTEYVLRHGGAKHLRSPAANISWWEYQELELSVLTLLLELLFIFIVIPITMYKLCIYWVNNSSKIKDS